MELYGHSPKKEFVVIWIRRFKFFIVDNDEAIIDKLLYNFKKSKVSLVNQK